MDTSAWHGLSTGEPQPKPAAPSDFVGSRMPIERSPEHRLAEIGIIAGVMSMTNDR